MDGILNPLKLNFVLVFMVFLFVQVCLAVYLLWDTIGPPILSGLVLLLLLVPFNAAIGYFQQRLQRENLKWKDQRIKVMTEVLGGIKVRLNVAGVRD